MSEKWTPDQIRVNTSAVIADTLNHLEAELKEAKADSKRVDKLERFRHKGLPEDDSRTWAIWIDKYGDVRLTATDMPIGSTSVKYFRTAREMLDALEEPNHE